MNRTWAAAALAVLVVSTVLTGCDSGETARTVKPPTAYHELWRGDDLPGVDVRGPGDVQVTDDLTVLTAVRKRDGEGQLVGVDTKTGVERWRLTVDEAIPGNLARLYDATTFAISGDTVLVPVWVRDQAGIAAISAVNGFVQWMSLRPDRFSAPSVIGVSGETVIWNHEDYDTGASEVLAVSAETGKELWSQPGLRAVSVSGGYVVTVQPDGAEGRTGRPRVLDLTTGRRRWGMDRPAQVDAVSGGWFFAERLRGSGGTGAYRLRDGRFVPAHGGRIGQEPEAERVVALGQGLAWAGEITDTQTYQVLPDTARSPKTLEVGFDAGPAAYTFARGQVLADVQGQKPGTATYGLNGQPSGAPVAGWFVGVYGPRSKYLVTTLGREPSSTVVVHRADG